MAFRAISNSCPLSSWHRADVWPACGRRCVSCSDPVCLDFLVYSFWRGLASISFIGSTSETVEAAFGDTSQCLLGSSPQSPVKVP